MKFCITFSLLFFFEVYSFSQIEYNLGYYIDNYGKRNECLIENFDWKNNPKGISFKMEQSDFPKETNILSIKEFEIYNFSKYIRAYTKIDRSSQDINKLSSDKNPVLNDEISSLRSVFFSDENKGISAGYGGTLLIYSADKWTRENPGTTRNLNGTAITGNTYYAVGDGGTIISKNLGNKDITGNNPEDMAEKIEAYPNPCDETLNFKIPGGGLYPKVKVSVTNANGQVFLQKEYSNLDGDQENQIFTSGLKNGLYFLQADTGSEIFKTKVIVLH